ncbi:MAG: hypothetical protein M1829_001876 [Trizodia sp. TS-e1964]|nr:MAG: hypothetical protein M1829_001876 [Trizodia sp. TS-e1964]
MRISGFFGFIIVLHLANYGTESLRKTLVRKSNVSNQNLPSGGPTVEFIQAMSCQQIIQLLTRLGNPIKITQSPRFSDQVDGPLKTIAGQDSLRQAIMAVETARFQMNRDIKLKVDEIEKDRKGLDSPENIEKSLRAENLIFLFQHGSGMMTQANAENIYRSLVALWRHIGTQRSSLALSPDVQLLRELFENFTAEYLSETKEIQS